MCISKKYSKYSHALSWHFKRRNSLLGHAVDEILNGKLSPSKYPTPAKRDHDTLFPCKTRNTPPPILWQEMDSLSQRLGRRGVSSRAARVVPASTTLAPTRILKASLLKEQFFSFTWERQIFYFSVRVRKDFYRLFFFLFDFLPHSALHLH